jgi:MFS family permease
MAIQNGTVEEVKGRKGGFWSYLKDKELDYFPTGALRWWLVAIITIAWATEQFERGRLAPVLVYFLKDFDITLRTSGLYHLPGVAASGLGAFLLGGIADRYGRRVAIIWPMAIYLLFLAGLASAPNVTVYFALNTLGAFVIMGMSAAVNAAIRDVIPQTGRALAYAFITLAWAAGSFMTLGVGALTIHRWPGWRAQLWIGLIIAIFITAFILIFYRDLSARIRGMVIASREEATEAEAKALGFRPTEIDALSGRIIYRTFHIWMIAVCLFFFGVTYATFTGYLPTFLTQYHGIEPARAAKFSTFVFVAGGLAAFISGWISDRTGLRKLLLSIFAGVNGVLIISLAFMPKGTSPGTLMFLLLPIGILFGCFYCNWCAILAENTEAVSPYGVGRAFGMAGIALMLQGLTTTLVLPQVVERLSWPAWIFCAGLFCASCVGWISFAKDPWFKSKFAKVKAG